MRKFFGILLICIIFFACLYAGIYLAENTASPTVKNNSNIEIDSSNQANLLVLVVDRLDQSPVNFISAWSVIVYHHRPDGLVILPLSLRNDANNSTLAGAFQLDSSRQLRRQAINAFQSTFDAQWDGYIIVDLAAMQTLIPWITSHTIMYSAEEFMINTANIDNLSFTLDSICGTISQNSIPAQENLAWDTIYPLHLSSNLREADLQSIWGNITADAPLKCEWTLPQ